MIIVKVPKIVLEKSEKLNNSCNMGNRISGGNGSKEEQLTGIIGQNMVRYILRQPPMTGEEFDGGIDGVLTNGQSYDVKTMGRTVAVGDGFTNNFMAAQKKFTPDLYIFCSYRKPTQELTICGFIPRSEFDEKALLFTAGTKRTRSDGSSIVLKADMYEIDNSKLYNPIYIFSTAQIERTG